MLGWRFICCFLLVILLGGAESRSKELHRAPLRRVRARRFPGAARDSQFAGGNDGEGRAAAAVARSRRRRAASSTEETVVAGARFYVSQVSYTDWKLPDLSKASVMDLTNKSFGGRPSTTVVDLPFNFSFFGQQHAQVQVRETGFVWPHSPREAPTEHNFAALEEHLFRTSHISPLHGPWSTDASRGLAVLMYSDLEFVHIVWSVTLRDVCNGTTQGSEACLSSPNTTFSATLYKSGRIAFNYEELESYNFYAQRSSWKGFGQIGLADSSVLDYNVSRGADFAAVRYADVDLSSAFNLTATPKSIVFTVRNRSLCLQARSSEECGRLPPELACFWCSSHAGYQQVASPFCTDGKTGRNAVHVLNLGCAHEGNSSIIEEIHHRYYTVKTSNHLPSTDFSKAKLMYKGSETDYIFQRTILPFEFPFYGHKTKIVYLSNDGQIFPHASFCAFSYFTCSSEDWFFASAIRPLYATWGAHTSSRAPLRSSAVLRLDDPQGSYVRFVWQNVRRVVDLGPFFITYPQPNVFATFAVTLFKTGVIRFEYPHLDDWDRYYFGEYFGQVGIHDSLYSSRVPHVFRFSRLGIFYGRINRTKDLSANASQVRSITFTPSSQPTCNGKETLTACQSMPAHLQCVWCVPDLTLIAYRRRSQPFCSDGPAISLPGLHCSVATPNTNPPTPGPQPSTATRPTTAYKTRPASPRTTTRPATTQDSRSGSTGGQTAATQDTSTDNPRSKASTSSPTTRRHAATEQMQTSGASNFPSSVSRGERPTTAPSGGDAFPSLRSSPHWDSQDSHHKAAKSSGSTVGVALGATAGALIILGAAVVLFVFRHRLFSNRFQIQFGKFSNEQ